MLFDEWEYEPVAWGRGLAGMRDQPHHVGGMEICCYYGRVCVCIGRVQHESMETFLAALAPGLKNLKQTVMLVPVCFSCAPVHMGHSDKKPSLPKQKSSSAFQRPAIF